jgi:hypothetical protein
LAKEASLAPLAKEASLAGLSLGVPEEITTMFRSVLRAIRNVTLRSK